MTRGPNGKPEGSLSKDERKTSQGYVEIKKKTIEELEEMIERQNKLLLNRQFLDKLPDKGKKIFAFRSELEEEYMKRQRELESTCELLNNLSLNEKTPEDLEWNEGKPIGSKEDELDSDDEEVDPLKLIATHSGTASGKSYKVNTEKKLYVDKFCEKYGKPINFKERFKPNQLKNNDKMLFVKSAEKVKERLGKNWEITEATPPVPVYKDTVMISLPESLKLQKEQAEKLKEIEKKHATERLIQSMSVKMGNKLPVNNISEYRTSNYFSESVEYDDGSELNDSDEDDNEKTVSFPTDIPQDSIK